MFLCRDTKSTRNKWRLCRGTERKWLEYEHM